MLISQMSLLRYREVRQPTQRLHSRSRTTLEARCVDPTKLQTIPLHGCHPPSHNPTEGFLCYKPGKWAACEPQMRELRPDGGCKHPPASQLLLLGNAGCPEAVPWESSGRPHPVPGLGWGSRRSRKGPGSCSSCLGSPGSWSLYLVLPGK